jgi:hypothetical protein
LESVYTGNRIVGSNPTPSATTQKYSATRAFSLRYARVPHIGSARPASPSVPASDTSP